MKPDDKIEIIRNPYAQPDNIKKILLIALCSFAVGLVPMLSGINSSTTGMVIPSEKTLWQ